jgi:hypothetical protein
LLAEALLGEGMIDQAAAQLNSFLGGRSVRKMPLRIRILFDRIQYQKNSRSAFPASKKAAVPKTKYIDYIHNPPQDLPDFEPAKSQEEIGRILALVGNNVSILFANLLNISAIEKIQLEKLSKENEAEPGQNFENLYLCMGAVDKNDPSFDEYRSDFEGHEISRLGLNNGYMLTSGFVAAPLIFHPLHQNGSTFRLLGHQKLNGRDTIVMAFAQIPTRSRMSGSFQFGGNAETTFKQGMAWIDAQNYQILRLVSDLLTPIPWVGLDRVKTQIDFSEIHFDQKSFTFWLPVKVVVTVAWNGKVLRNTHAYSDFRLFNVEVSVKMATPSG